MKDDPRAMKAVARVNAAAEKVRTIRRAMPIALSRITAWANQPARIRLQVKAIQDKQADLEIETLKQQQLAKQQEADKHTAVQLALEHV